VSEAVTRPVSSVSGSGVGDGVDFCREARKTVRFKVKMVRFMWVLVRFKVEIARFVVYFRTSTTDFRPAVGERDNSLG